MALLVALGRSSAWGLSAYLLLTAPPGAMPHLYFEGSAVLISFVLLGKWLEGRAKGQTAAPPRPWMACPPAKPPAARTGAEAEGPVDQRLPATGSVLGPASAGPADGPGSAALGSAH